MLKRGKNTKSNFSLLSHRGTLVHTATEVNHFIAITHNWDQFGTSLAASRRQQDEWRRTVFVRNKEKTKRGGTCRPANDQRLTTNDRSYVPSLHPARYSSCSGLNRSILIPIDSSFSLATRLSSSSGTL
jgi:hypothetical protein